MKRNKTRTQRGAKKFLSVVLAASMLIPSMLNGTMIYTTYAAELFSDQSIVESDEFTDKVGEDKNSMNTEEIQEAVQAFNDEEGLNAMEESSAGKKNEIILVGTNVNVKSGMFDVINNHDGSLTIKDGDLKVDGTFEIQGSSKMDYCVAYNYSKYSGSKAVSSWNNSEQSYKQYDSGWEKYSSDKTISLTNSYWLWGYNELLYTCISVGRYDDNMFCLATFQEVRNPVKVKYDPQGGTGEPKTDWVWNKPGDNSWNNIVPTKKESQFLGWYTSPGNDGEKIESVAEIVSVSDEKQNNEITLYAHWKEHEHSWEYVTDEDNKNILKAYCSNPDIPCAYYGTSEEPTKNPVTLILQLEGLENGCISYSGNSYNGAQVDGRDAFINLTGASVTGPVYVGRNPTNYQENSKAPTNPGTYTVKVAVGDSSNPKQYELTADFEIIRANINSTSGVTMKGWTYGSYDSKINVPSLADAEKTNPGNGDVTYSYYTNESCTEDAKTSKANGAAKIGDVPKNAGIYYVKAEIPATTNYNSGTATGSFAIKPLPVTVKWSDSKFTYNRTQHTVTATIINALPDDEFKLTYDGNTGTNAGNYEAKITSLGNPNYSLSDESGDPITAISHSWEIKPKEVTVKARNLSKHIGNENPDFRNTNKKYDVDGLEKDDKIYGVCLERKSKQEDAGTYENDIVVTIDPNDAIRNSNYKVKLVNGTFTITDHDWTPEEVVTPATTWSEGMKVKTCKVAECSYHQNGKYYTIPKTGEEDDEYADCIDQYTHITGSDITKAVLNNKKSQFLLSESNVFTPEEKEKIEKRLNGNNKAEVWLRITPLSFEQNILDLIRNETKKIAGTEVPDCFFDASLYSKFPGKAESNIKDAGIPINIRIQIPDNMVNKQPYTIRTYKVLRLHQDTNNQYIFDILDASFNSGTNEVTFETDKFSIFALAYKDTYYSPSYPVTGIKVSSEGITLTKKDETAQLTAEVTPSYADNKKVTWKSSDEKVATVDENGKVTAVGNGTATITATSVSGSYTATVSVTVKIPVEIEKLTIEAEKETLTKIGETTELKVKIEPENADEQKLIWESDNEMVAAVDENGKVTAVGNGTGTITVTTEDGRVTASVTITVKVPEKPVINKTTGFGRLRARSAKQTKTSVTLQWNKLNDVDGYLIYGNRCNGNGKTYKYKKLATITSGKNQTWVQKGLKKGTFYKYVVKAYKLVDGKKVITDVSTSVHTVTQGGAYGIAKSVSVTKIGNKKNTLGVTLQKGQKAQITAKEVEKDNKIKHHRNLCYESSNTEVATVTSKGLIRAKGKGTCKIWVYAQNGVYKELTITVK